MLNPGDVPGPTAGVDHVVVGAPDLESGASWARDMLGVEAVEGGRHARWRTRNALVGLGPGTYLEILAPDGESNPGIDGDRDGVDARPFDLDTVTEPTLVAWALRVSDVEAVRDEAARHGLPVGPILRGSRERPDGSTLRWRLSDPAAVPSGGAVPFLIDWQDSEHPSGRLAHPCWLESLEISASDADGIESFLAEAAAPLAIRLIVNRSDGTGIRARLRTPAGMVEVG